MNRRRFALTVVVAFAAGHSALSQGPLNPSGPPAPTMKSLDQLDTKLDQNGAKLDQIGASQTAADARLEKRTPISSLPFTITAPGSYYLTGNITVASGDAITIAADNVTLDLNGFALISTSDPPSGNGVQVTGTRSNLTVTNGHIRGTGNIAGGVFTGGRFLNGIRMNDINDRFYNVRISRVSVHGVAQSGITVSPFGEGLVTDCSVSYAGDVGIFARVIRSSSANACGGNALSADVVEASNGQNDSSSGNGIVAAIVSNSYGRSGTCNGIQSSGSVTNSIGSSSSGIGLQAGRATNSEGTSATGPFGMQVFGTASFCNGARPGGVAVSAAIAIACTATSGTISSPSKHLGTP